MSLLLSDVGNAAQLVEDVLESYEDTLTGTQQEALHRALELLNTVYIQLDHEGN